VKKFFSKISPHLPGPIQSCIIAVCLFIFCISIGVLSIPEVDKNSNNIGFFSKHRIKVPDYVVSDSGEVIDTSEETITPYPADPITAVAYLVGDLSTGEIYFEKNKFTVRPIASISKIFAALAVEDLLSSTTDIFVTEDMLNLYGTTTGITAGSIISSAEIVYPILLESSNDAAYIAATSSGYSKFIGYMNASALEIGLVNTRFSDPSGLSPLNVSNASDLFNFAKHLYKRRLDLLEKTRLPSHDVLISIETAISTATSTEMATSTRITYKNTNPMIGDSTFIGGKTGRTDAARETMLSIFKYVIAGREYPIAIIVLGSDYGMRQIDTSVLSQRFIESRQ
jgi:serine-type D-Ala-D-Ala endopeptidase (penicillin-binding protein 7)